MNAWTIRVYNPGEWLTANKWYTMHIYQRAKLVAAWREATVAACYIAGLPAGHNRPVTISAEVVYRGRPPVRDTPNIESTIKPIVDGLGPAPMNRNGGRDAHRGYGFIPDDSDRYVTRGSLTLRKATPEEQQALRTSIGFVDLTITTTRLEADPLLTELADRRRGRGLSQRQMAAATGTTQSAISEVETGTVSPTLQKLRQLCDVLDVDIVLVSRGTDG